MNAKKLGLAGGILWGLYIFICTMLSVFTGYGKLWLTILTDAYPGFMISVGGAFVGFLYAFLDGFIALFLLAWLYNKLKI